MSALEKNLNKLSVRQTKSKPLLFDLSIKKDRQKVETLIKKGQVHFVTDEYLVQLEEYFQVENPSLVFKPNFKKEFEKYVNMLKENKPLEKQGVWVYFPWLLHLVHVLKEDAFFKVRTARNKNLITEEEQNFFYEAVVGIAGMSIGNSVALAIVQQGGAKHIKLADFDDLELSNTNRIRTGVTNLGSKKVEMTAREIYTINPYAKVEVFKYGLTEENLTSFFNDLDIMVDEIDHLGMKYKIREMCKVKKIPLVMGADNGDNVIVDIERFDINKNTTFFNGRLGKISYSSLQNLEKFEVGRLIVKLLGVENITERMLKSFINMGKTLVSWPQLGGAAQINGAILSNVIRRLVNNQELPKERFIVNIDEKVDPKYNHSTKKNQRLKVSKDFKKLLKI